MSTLIFPPGPHLRDIPIPVVLFDGVAVLAATTLLLYLNVSVRTNAVNAMVDTAGLALADRYRDLLQGLSGDWWRSTDRGRRRRRVAVLTLLR